MSLGKVAKSVLMLPSKGLDKVADYFHVLNEISDREELSSFDGGYSYESNYSFFGDMCAPVLDDIFRYFAHPFSKEKRRESIPVFNWLD